MKRYVGLSKEEAKASELEANNDRQKWRSRMGLKTTDDVVVENEELRKRIAELEGKLQPFVDATRKFTGDIVIGSASLHDAIKKGNDKEIQRLNERIARLKAELDKFYERFRS